MSEKLTVTQRKLKHNPNQPVGRWIRVEKRLAIYLRDGFRCLYCNVDLHGVSDPRRIQLDHVTPVSDGGSNREGNVITACEHCNCSRGKRNFREFADKTAKERVRRNTRLSLRSYKKLAVAILAGQLDRQAACEQVRAKGME